MGRHDRSYRQLFAHPGMVASLLRLLGRRATGPLDLATLERVQDGFVSERLAARQADLLWRVRRPGGTPVYLLIEIQSRPERFMALRMLAYVALLAQDLAASRTLTPDGRIPEVIPLVVYTGDRRWGPSAEVAECFAGTGPHRPRMRFRLVDQRKVPAGRLLRTPGPVGALFLLERHRTPAELEQGVRLLVRRLAAPEDGPLRRAFLVWLQAVLLPGRDTPEREIPALLDLQELRSMLETRVREWNRQLREEGRREGRLEGKREGRVEGRGDGEAAVLLRQLETRFGPLDEVVRAWVRRATSEQRLAWATRVLTAGSLEDVFRR
jgi:predicted transposase YdaD